MKRKILRLDKEWNDAFRSHHPSPPAHILAWYFGGSTAQDEPERRLSDDQLTRTGEAVLFRERAARVLDKPPVVNASSWSS